MQSSFEFDISPPITFSHEYYPANDKDLGYNCEKCKTVQVVTRTIS